MEHPRWRVGLVFGSLLFLAESAHGGMKERKPWPMLPVAILLAAAMLLGAYVAGYFRLRKAQAVRDSSGPVPVVGGVVRLYPHKWQVTAYQPVATLESLCIGVQVQLGDFGTYGDPDEEEP